MTSSKEVSNMKESELIKMPKRVIKMLFASFMNFIKTGFIVMPIINFRAKKTQRTPLWIAFSALGRG